MNIIREGRPTKRKCKKPSRMLSLRSFIVVYVVYMCITLSVLAFENKTDIKTDTEVNNNTYVSSLETEPNPTFSVYNKNYNNQKYAVKYLAETIKPQIIELAELSEETAIKSTPEPTPEPTIEPTPEPTPNPVSEPFHQDEFTGDSSIMCMSGLTAEQIEGMLDNYYGLDGLGEVIYKVEQENGVNAFYTLAVASLESGYGKSDLAQYNNNLFGLMGCKFDSKEDCVEYFGRLMINYRDKHDITMTPNGINPRYCTSDTWAGKITQLMNQWARKANEMY